MPEFPYSGTPLGLLLSGLQGIALSLAMLKTENTDWKPEYYGKKWQVIEVEINYPVIQRKERLSLYWEKRDGEWQYNHVTLEGRCDQGDMYHQSCRSKKWSSRDGRRGKEGPPTAVRLLCLLCVLGMGWCWEDTGEKCNLCPPGTDGPGGRWWARNQGRRAADEEPHAGPVYWSEGRAVVLTAWQYTRSEILSNTTDCTLNHLILKRSENWAGRRRAWSWGGILVESREDPWRPEGKEECLMTRGWTTGRYVPKEGNLRTQRES